MSSESPEVVQNAITELERFIDEAKSGEPRELAIRVHERYSEKTVHELTDDEQLLLEAVAYTYEQQANWEESNGGLRPLR